VRSEEPSYFSLLTSHFSLTGGIMAFFRNVSICFRLTAIYCLIFTLSVTLGNVFVYFFVRHILQGNIENDLKHSAAAISNMIRIAADSSVRNYLRAAAEKNKEIVEHIWRKHKDGAMTEEAAKNLARDILLGQTVGRTGYVYCLSGKGILTVHPKAVLDGADISEYDFVQEQIKSKTGYLEYEWQNPDEERKRKKSLYMTYFEPWDWIVSVSSYQEEFSDLIQVDELREYILPLRFGTTGYPYIIDSRGLIVIHPKLERGYSLLDDTVSKNQMFIKKICEQKKGRITYQWKNPDESVLREKLAVFDYIPRTDWIVVCSSSLEEFYSPLDTLRYIIVSVIVFTLIPVIILTLRVSHKIARPLELLTQAVRRLADFDLTVWDSPPACPCATGDEIGILTEALNIMTWEFRSLVGEVKTDGRQLADFSGLMTGRIAAVAEEVGEISVNVKNVSDTAEQMSQNVGAVAGAIEEMSASVKEVGKNARQGSHIAKDAVLMAEKAGSTMTSLGDAANEIGAVTRMIKKIADKTSLLALNAHIEAASAGEAGKGFAVVANEIKEFARQSTRAAEDISGRISLMQNNTAAAVSSIGDVSGIINTIARFSETISFSLDEQMKAVNEIAFNAGQAGLRARDIATTMEELANRAKELSVKVEKTAGGSSGDTDVSAAGLSELACGLLNLVEKFKISEKSEK